MKHKLFNILMVIVLMLTLTSAGLAQQGGLEVVGAPEADSTYTAEVEKDAPVAMMAPRAASDFSLVSVIVTFDKTVDASAIEAATGGTVVHTYKKIFNGASVVLPGENVAELAQMDGVSGVYLDELMQPDTEHSPWFIGAPAVWTALGGQGSAGEGVTVGILDTGVWPEHPSFADPDPSGKSYAPPSVLPGSNGFAGAPRSTCDFGNTAYNPMDEPFECNNKLIGAYQFLDTYKLVNSLPVDGFDSARDDEGHGTHTASTAAGNAGVEATVFGVNRGKVSGIAPRAYVIAYRVCGLVGCYSSDSAAAVEQAILDEVDAINFSISGGSNPYSDAVSLAFLAAYENGVFVAASAGNSGPGADTTAHREPWVTTVAASTQNRAFEATATVTGSGGATLSLTGASITDGVFMPAEVVVAPDPLCLGPYTPGQFAGQIVVCRRGTTGRAEKGYEVSQGDAAGMILYNQSTAVTDLETDSHYLPTVHIQYTQGQDLLAFLAANPGATATMTAGVPATAQGDVMASFSSRGGAGQSLGISKPDITAPGVQILAGNTGYSVDVSYGPDGNLFQAIAGTSMSSPHIAGSAALLKALHPNWTPGQIKSAMMTTANPNVVKEDGVTPATPFDHGSGRVNLGFAGNPGLTFDETAANYVALQSQLWNSNYPSLYMPAMPGMITVQRTVHSELSTPSTWRLYSSAPADVKVITPASINVAAGGNATFSITVDASRVPLGEVRHATLFLAYNNKTVRFPISFVRKQPAVTLTKSCDPTSFNYRASTLCTITAANTGFADAFVDLVDVLPTGMFVLPGSLSGATMPAGNTIAFSGTLAGAQPPDVTVAPGVSPAGYLPLSLFGVAPVSGVGDETITNFNVPAFTFAGVSYSRIGFVSNGYLVVGGGTAADVQFINQSLPNAAPPNNVLAPFWSDLNPAFGGAMRIATLTDGIDTWLVLDWENVANYSDRLPNSFQVWIRIGAVEDITFTYGEAISGGDLGFLTVGAENSFGNRGQNFYVDGIGTPPAFGVDVRVSSVPSTPGETHTITFTAKVVKPATYTNCAKMTSDIFPGVNVACTTVTATR